MGRYIIEEKDGSIHLLNLKKGTYHGNIIWDERKHGPIPEDKLDKIAGFEREDYQEQALDHEEKPAFQMEYELDEEERVIMVDSGNKDTEGKAIMIPKTKQSLDEEGNPIPIMLQKHRILVDDEKVTAAANAKAGKEAAKAAKISRRESMNQAQKDKVMDLMIAEYAENNDIDPDEL